jgi:mono/diheme cytochrome c family protein
MKPVVSRFLMAATLLCAANTHAQVNVPEGQAVYERHCLACHQAGGKGAPGLAPAVAQVLAPLNAREDGARYIAQVLVHGLSGRIVSQGQVFNGAMPPQSSLSDDELAQVANHLVRDLNGDTAARFTAADFARTRTEKVSHKALRDLRAKLMP